MTRHGQPMAESNQEIVDKLIATVRSKDVEPDSTADDVAVMSTAGLCAAAAIDRFTDVVTSPRNQEFPARDKPAP